MATNKHKVEFNLSLTGLAAVEKGFSKIKGTLGNLTGFASKLTLGLTGLGGALSLAGLGAGIKNITDMAGGISDVAAQTKLTVREVTIFQQAFKDAGLSTESLSIAIFQMDKNLIAARDTGGELEMVFKRLGLNIEELTELSTAERFLKISSAIASLRKESEKSRAAMQIFGKSGAAMKSIWADNTAFASAERLLGQMPALFEKNAALWDSISDSIGNVGIKSQQFFAGFLDQNDTAIRRILDAYESVDLTGFGARVGAKLQETFDKFSKGDIWGGVVSGMSTIWQGFKSGFEIVTELANAAFLDIDLQPFFKVLSAGFAELAIEFPKLFWTQFYKIGETLGEKAAQASLEMLSVAEIKQLQRTIARTEQRIALIKSGRVVGREAARLPEYETELARAKRRLPIATEELQQLYKLGAEAERARSEEFSKAILGAVSQPKSNLAAVWEATQKRLGIGVTPPLTSPPVSETSTAELDASSYDWQRRIEELNRDILDSQKQLNALRVQDVALATELEAVMHQTRLTDANFSLTELQKYQEKKTLLTEESKKHEEQIILLTRQNTELGKQLTAKKELFELLADPEQEAAYEREIAMLERSIELNNNAIERIRNYSELSAFALGPEMTSFSAQIEQSILSLQNAWGSLAMQSANVFRRMADSATSTLGNAFTGLILQTKTLGQAFQEMGRMLLESMVSAIAEVFARWLVLKASMATFSIGGGGGFLGGIFGFAEGGRIPASQKIIRVNEEGSEYVVSARSPRVNDDWLDYANQGGRLADFAAAQGVATAAPAASKTVIVRSQSEIRREWKESGLIDFVRDGFSKRGLNYA